MEPYSGKKANRRRRLFRKRISEEEDRAAPANQDYPPQKSRLSTGAILLIIIFIAAIFAIAIRTNFGVPKKQGGCYVINRNGEKEYRTCK